MTKKKSIVTLLLAFCMIIPAMFMVTACGNTVRTTINDSAEWQSALKFEDVDNYCFTVTYSDRRIEKRVNETSAYIRSTTDGQLTEKYYNLEDGKVCQYTYDAETAKWTRTELSSYTTIASIMEVEGGKLGTPYTTILNSYDDEKYDEKEQAYIIESATIESQSATNLKLSFEDGKLARFEFTKMSKGATPTPVQHVYEYSYGGVKITIPTL